MLLLRNDSNSWECCRSVFELVELLKLSIAGIRLSANFTVVFRALEDKKTGQDLEERVLPMHVRAVSLC